MTDNKNIFTNNKKSELYKINHSSNKLEAQELSNDLYKVIKQGLYYSDLSKGSFDITIGSISSLWDFKKHTLPEDTSMTLTMTNKKTKVVETLKFDYADFGDYDLDIY